jgi:hypothetical protein
VIALTITSNGNVGIGVTNPTQKLSVGGGGIKLDNAQNVYWRNSGNNADTAILTLSGDTTILRGGGGNPTLQLQSNGGTALMTLMENGSLGIGTSTPYASTTIWANSTVGDAFKVVNNASTTLFNVSHSGIASTTGLTISNVGGVGTRCLQTDASGVISANASACGGAAGGGADGNWVFDTSSRSFITLATTTNLVGVGTTSPYAKLSIKSGSIASTTLALQAEIGQTANIWDIYNSSGVRSSVMTAAGSLGLGTTTPAALLALQTLNQSVSVPSFIIASSSTNVATTTQLVFQNGNLGVGVTSTPQARITASTANLQQTWSQVGSGLSANSGPLAALSPNRVAHIDATSNTLRTFEFNGSSWTQVGSSLAIGGGTPALTGLSPNRVAFFDLTSDSLRTYEFSGTTWTQVGSGLTISSINTPVLTTLSSNRVAFIDADNDSLRTYEFNGITWKQVGNGLAVPNDFPALAALSPNRVAYFDFTNLSLRTYEFNGITWTQVGHGLGISGAGFPALAALSPNRVAFIDSTNQSLRTYEFSGTTWTQTGSGLTIASAGSPKLTALSPNRVAFIDATNNSLRTYQWSAPLFAAVDDKEMPLFAVSDTGMLTIGGPAATTTSGGINFGSIRFLTVTNDFGTTSAASSTRALIGLETVFSEKVGIGTSTPWGKLSIVSDSTSTPLFVVGSTTASGHSSLFTIGSDGGIISSSTATSTFRHGININGGCFAVNGTCIGGGQSSAVVDYEIFESTGGTTYTVPAAGSLIIVEAWGAGGGGGGGAAGNIGTNRAGGGGGGGGAYNTRTFVPGDIGGAGANITVTAGAGGGAGAGVNNAAGNDGTTGGNTTFGSFLSAFGGGGGGGNASSGGGGGGGGGTTTAGTASTNSTGGAGGGPAGGAANTNAVYSQGGGGGGGSAAANGTAGGNASWGGGGGGGSTTVGGGSSHGGGASARGGGGGGAGGSINASTNRAGGGGGASIPSNGFGTGGAAGPNNGNAGYNASGRSGSGLMGFGGAGGNGGGSATTNNGGNGGNGGIPGGGGGGGGAVQNNNATKTGGNGGAGARGEVRVFTVTGTIGADLAEMYSTRDATMGAADVVSIDTTLKAGVKKSSAPYDRGLMGVISTKPSITMGSNEDPGTHPALLALAGRVPVRVNLEGGPIRPGDFITSSSEPGIGMKATRAGPVVGRALTGWESDGVEKHSMGVIVIFVQNGYYNGEAIGPPESPPPEGFGRALLEMYVEGASASTTASTTPVTSELFLDRLGAGVEVITPKITAARLSVDEIDSALGADIRISLGGGGMFSIGHSASTTATSTATTTPGIVFDSIGNGIFAGSVSAKDLTLDGKSVHEQLASISVALAALTSSTTASTTVLSFAADPPGTASTSTSTPAELGNVDLAALLGTDGLVMENIAVLKGGLQVDSIASIGTLMRLLSDTEFIGRPYFNADTAGFAMVRKGAKEVEVLFETPYLEQPIVNATISLETASTSETDIGATSAASVDLEALAEKIFEADIRFLITKKSTEGFTILLNRPAPVDLQFSWTAFAVKEAAQFESEEAEPEPESPPEEPDAPAEESPPSETPVDVPEDTPEDETASSTPAEIPETPESEPPSPEAPEGESEAAGDPPPEAPPEESEPPPEAAAVPPPGEGESG